MNIRPNFGSSSAPGGTPAKFSRPSRRHLPVQASIAGFAFGAVLVAGMAQMPAFGTDTAWGDALLVVAAGLLVLATAQTARRILRLTLRARAAESRARALFEQTAVGFLRVARDGTIAAANQRSGAMLRRACAGLAGKPLEKLFLDPFSFTAFGKSAGMALELRMLRGDGLHFRARATASALCRGEILAVLEDVSETSALRDAQAQQGDHDGLTGLINRREIERRLESVLASAQGGDARHTCCYLDLDAFKLINDACGHATGDKALRMVAATLSNEMALPGWVGRLGGDEFVVLFEFVPLDNGLQMAERLNRVLGAQVLVHQNARFPLTASIGVVEIDRDTPSAAWVLRAADTACYLAKTSGRNRVREYVEADQDISQRRNEIEWASQIRNAVAQDRLLLYAQRIEPLVPHAEQGLQYEVLLRLQDDAGGIVPPGEFLAAAEKFSMATVVDRTVLTSAVDFLEAHAAHLRELTLCHLNVSGQSATSADFRQFVVELMAAHPQVARKLCFELTETAAVDHVQANEFIAGVRRFGCRIALDDFGNGLSSFAYLKKLPADIVKIDSIFVRGVDMDALDLAVVQSITGVCRALGKRVVAEGVESLDVLERLRDIGVDAAQGFALHRPAPITTLLEREYPMLQNATSPAIFGPAEN